MFVKVFAPDLIDLIHELSDRVNCIMSVNLTKNTAPIISRIVQGAEDARCGW
jgi:hypothetical protein